MSFKPLVAFNWMPWKHHYVPGHPGKGGTMPTKRKNSVSLPCIFSLLMICTAMACMCRCVYALDTGNERLEVWGYIQNETAWHTTDNPGLKDIFTNKGVAPGLGNFGHPAAFIINGLSRQNTVDHSGTMQKFESTFNLKVEYKLIKETNRKLSVFGRFYTLVDNVYDFRGDTGYRAGGLPGAKHGPGDASHYYRNDFHSRTTKRMLRELYVDYNVQALDVRIGKQMIVWGEIDGFRLLDLVNPFDLREFILDDYEDSRIPQWSIDLKWRFLEDHPDQNLEFVFIPDFESNQLMKEGSTWEPDDLKVYYAGDRAFSWVDKYNLFGPNYHYKNKYKEPGQLSLDNSNVGLRYGGTLSNVPGGALSYSFSYLYTWDYSWTPFVKGWFTPLGGNQDSHHAIPGITDLFLMAPTTLERKHMRNHVFGFTFNKVFGHYAIRGESALTLHKYVAVDPLLSSGRDSQDMAKKKNTLDYCLGFDRTVFTDWFLSGQIIQNIVLSAPKHMVTGLSLTKRKNIDTHFTFVVSKPFKRWNDQVGMSALIAYGTEGEWWFSPKLWWEVTQNTKAVLGAQIFEGDHYQGLGEFKRNSMVYTQVKYSF
jgi:hypothetical protein